MADPQPSGIFDHLEGYLDKPRQADGPQQPQQTTPQEAPQGGQRPAAATGQPDEGIDLGPFNMTVGALRDAGQSVIGLATDATNEMLDTRVPLGPLGVVDSLAKSITGQHLPGVTAVPTLGETLGLRARALDLPQIARSDHEWVNAGRSVLKYVAGAVGGMAGLRAMGAGGGVITDMVGGFIGDFAVADKADGNLSNLIEEVPALQGPITRALSIDEDDSNWEVRLKTAVEGTVVGAALSGLIKTVGILRQAKKLPAEEAKGFLDAHADELAEAAEDLRNAPEQLELFPDVVRREDNLKDIDLLIRGDRVIDPVTGEGKAINLSEAARREIDGLSSVADASHKLGDLSEATRAEVVAELRRVRAIQEQTFSEGGSGSTLVRPKPFALSETGRTQLGDALRKTLDAGPLADDLAEALGRELDPAFQTAFNYRYMDTPESVKMVVDDFAAALKPMMDARRGGAEMTFKDVEGLADTLSVKPAFLFTALSNAARHAEALPSYIVAGKVWMQSLARDITTIAKAIDAGTATGTAEIELMRRVSVLEDLMVNLKGVQTAAARATAVGRIRTAAELTPTEITSLLDGMDRTNVRFVARKLSMAEGNVKQVAAIIQGSQLGRSFDIANEVFINGLLSGIKTHVINATTGALNTVLLPSYRVVGATLTGDMETAKEGLYFLRALRSHVVDAATMAGKAFRTESSILDTAYRQIEVDRHAITAANFNLDADSVLGMAVQTLGYAVRMPSRFLTTADEFFKQLSYRSSVVAQATREASEKGLSESKTLDYFVDGRLQKVSQVDTYIIDRMNRAFNPEHGFAVDQVALADARRVTFTQPLREDTWLGNRPFAERVQELAAGHPLVRHFVLPFVRVPANLLREAQYLTPLAPLRRQFWSDLQAGGARRADALGRLSVGSTFATAGMLMASEGLITGAGPADAELQRVMKQSGWQPYSVRVGDRYVSYQRFDPFSTVLGVIADAAFVFGKHNDGVQDDLAAGITLAVANAINSRSYLKGLTDIFSTLGTGGDKEGRLEAILKQRVGSYVPSISRDVAGAFDDESIKRVRTFLDAVMARTPGLSANVEAHRDNFGNKVLPPMGFPWSAINPFAYSQDKPSAAYKELMWWADGPIKARFPVPHYKWSGEIDLTQIRNAKTGQSAYDRWMELHSTPLVGGRSLQEHIEAFVEGGTYKQLKENAAPDPIYKDHPALRLLRQQMEMYRDQAFEKMLGEDGFDDLKKAVEDFRINRRLVPVAPAQRRESPTLERLLGR